MSFFFSSRSCSRNTDLRRATYPDTRSRLTTTRRRSACGRGFCRPTGSEIVSSRSRPVSFERFVIFCSCVHKCPDRCCDLREGCVEGKGGKITNFLLALAYGVGCHVVVVLLYSPIGTSRSTPLASIWPWFSKNRRPAPYASPQPTPRFSFFGSHARAFFVVCLPLVFGGARRSASCSNTGGLVLCRREIIQFCSGEEDREAINSTRRS